MEHPLQPCWPTPLLSATNPHPGSLLPSCWPSCLLLGKVVDRVLWLWHSRLSRCVTVVLPTSRFRSQCGGVPAGRPRPQLELGLRAAATGGAGRSARPASAWGSGGGAQLPLPGGFLQPGCPCARTCSASPRWPLPCVRRPAAGDAGVMHSCAASWTYVLSLCDVSAVRLAETRTSRGNMVLPGPSCR